jgi:hypothetical protein
MIEMVAQKLNNSFHIYQFKTYIPVLLQIIFALKFHNQFFFANSNFVSTLDISMSAVALALVRVQQLYGRERQSRRISSASAGSLAKVCFTTFYLAPAIN